MVNIVIAFNHILIQRGKAQRVGAGRPTVLTPQKVFQQLGYGLNQEMVGEVISSYLVKQKRQTPFKDGVPGRDWWRGFWTVLN